MRPTIIGLLILLIAACQESNGGSDFISGDLDPLPKEFRVGFYNMENLFDTEDDPDHNDDDFLPYGRYAWDAERYERKQSQMYRVLRNMDIQVLGMAEIENRKVIEELIAQAPKGRWAIAHKKGSDARGIECALIYDPSIFSLIDTELHSMSGKPDRGILEVGLEDAEGEVWRFFVNHWPSRREGVKQSESKRIRASESLLQAMSDHASDEHSIVMGDFNDEPNDASLQRLTALRNMAERGEFDIGTCVHRNEWYLFDQILVNSTLSDGQGWEGEEFEIFEENWMLYNNRKATDYFPNRTMSGNRYFGGFSDHLPVTLQIARVNETP